MRVREQIRQKLTDAFSPERLDVINESHHHRTAPGAESHFKVILVSRAFEGSNRVRRHRMVNQALREELAGPVHALSLRLYTPDQWLASAGEVAPSPDCAHK